MGLIRADEPAGEWAVRTATEQGLPGYVEDWTVLSGVAVLLSGSVRDGPAQTRHAGVRRPGSKRLRPSGARATVA
jgi:hypothetical protein